MPYELSTWRTSAVPASKVPGLPSSTAVMRSRVSAMLLSLVLSIFLTMSDSGADLCWATGTSDCFAVWRPTSPVTVMPCAASFFAKTLPASIEVSWTAAPSTTRERTGATSVG